MGEEICVEGERGSEEFFAEEEEKAEEGEREEGDEGEAGFGRWRKCHEMERVSGLSRHSLLDGNSRRCCPRLARANVKHV